MSHHLTVLSWWWATFEIRASFRPPPVKGASNHTPAGHRFWIFTDLSGICIWILLATGRSLGTISYAQAVLSLRRQPGMHVCVSLRLTVAAAVMLNSTDNVRGTKSKSASNRPQTWGFMSWTPSVMQSSTVAAKSLWRCWCGGASERQFWDKVLIDNPYR